MIPGKIFISHSEQDKPFAEAMLRALEGRGINCWIAPRDIRPGGSYADAILTAIEECSLFVLIYSDRCNKSGHVLREVERALKFEKNIVPVRFDDSAPSRSLDYLLATVHWLAVPAESRGASVEHAATQITGCLESLARQPTATIQPSEISMRNHMVSPNTKHRDLKMIWLFLALVLVSAFVFLGIVFVKSLRQEPPAETATGPSVPNESVRESTPASASPPTSPVPSPSQPAAESLPPQPLVPAASGNQPQEILRRYFASFRTRDVAEAYDCLSAKFRARLSFKKFSESFASTREIQLIDVRQISGNAESATVDTFFEETDANSRRVQWRGPITLVREPGGWRIETLKGLKSSAAETPR